VEKESTRIEFSPCRVIVVMDDANNNANTSALHRLGLAAVVIVVVLVMM
jgi:hypothetical protein